MIYDIKKGYENFIKDIQIHSTSLYFFKESEIDKAGLDSFMKLAYKSIDNMLSSKQFNYGMIAKQVNDECNNFIKYNENILSFNTEYSIVLNIPLLGNFAFNEEEKDLLDTIESDAQMESTIKKLIYDKAYCYVKNNIPSCSNGRVVEQKEHFIIKHITGLIEYIYKDLPHITAAVYKHGDKFIKNVFNGNLYKYGNIDMTNTGRIVFVPCNEKDAGDILVRFTRKGEQVPKEGLFTDEIATDYIKLYEFTDDMFYVKDIILKKQKKEQD